MSQYKGKREAPRPANENTRRETGYPTGQQKKPVGDPFFEEKPTLGERLEIFAEDLSYFFSSKKGKIITGVVCGVLAVAIGATVALKSWVKPPELPSVNVQTGTDTPADNDTKQPDGEAEQQPPAPTDDELYPDDGYSGDMPELSGQRKEGFYTFLLVGTDKDDGNTDTIMVASYDTVNQKISIMSIPRDTMINESWDIKKINSVYSRTGGNINSLANRVKKLIGFKPDFYVKVDLSVFVQLVDLVGGVEFYVPQDMDYEDPYQDLYIHLKEGQQNLDGEKAMQLVRFRGYSEGDIKRVQVQQEFLKALIKECLSLKHWGKIKAYIDLAMDNVQTDLDFGSVVWFASNVIGLNSAPMLDLSNVNTCTIPGNYWASAWSRATNSNQSYVTVYANQTIKLVNEQFNPYKQNVTIDMMDIMSILENGDIASSTGTVKDTKHNEVMAVRREEAYYDEEGNLVYVDPDGETTDDPNLSGEDGVSEPNGEEAGSSSEGESANAGDGGNTSQQPSGNEGSTTAPSDSGGTTESAGGENGENTSGTSNETGADEPSLPDEPTLPDESNDSSSDEGESNTGEDEEMPSWLKPQE